MNRIFLSKDNITLSHLHKSCFNHGWNAQEWADLLAVRGSECHVLAMKDRPVAFLLTRMVADEAEIISIGVLPEMRGRGLSGPILSAGLHSLFNQGVQQVFLEVRADNEAAKALYERAGFHCEGQRKNYYRPEGNASRDALIYVKQHR